MMMNMSKDISRKGKADVKTWRCEKGCCCNSKRGLLRMGAIQFFTEEKTELGLLTE